MAYSYGEPTYTVPISPYHTHGAFPYSFWGGTSVGMPGRMGYGPGMMGGMGRGMFGFPPSAMLAQLIPSPLPMPMVCLRGIPYVILPTGPTLQPLLSLNIPGPSSLKRA